jgi:hypothetical protein
LLAGDDALPDHEVDGPVRQGLRLGHEALQETKNRRFPTLPLCRTRGTNKLNWQGRKQQGRGGGRTRGGGSCATTCAPRRGGRGRCLQTPSEFQHGTGARSAAPPLLLLPRNRWAPVPRRCGFVLYCWTVGCLLVSAPVPVGESEYERFGLPQLKRRTTFLACLGRNLCRRWGGLS